MTLLLQRSVASVRPVAEMADGQNRHVQDVPAASGFGQSLDAVTLARARRGDMAAFADIYTRYAASCLTLAMRVLGERAVAEDVVQDVFLKMFATIRGFRGDAPFGAWLKRLTANATIDVVRSRSRFRGEDAEEVLDASASEGSEARAVDAWSLLARLPPRARAIVVLHEVEGYTHKELAEVFGQSESYSKSILARALKRLNDTATAERESADD